MRACNGVCGEDNVCATGKFVRHVTVHSGVAVDEDDAP